MDRGASVTVFSWLMAPAAAILLASALSLPHRPYTGITLRGEQAMGVVPGSPGARAGIAVGDRVTAAGVRNDEFHGPFHAARPGLPLALVRRRGAGSIPIELVPAPLPPGERRMTAALFAVASGFVLLGGWVWSERRDRLTRPFYLLCLAFAVVLVSPPLLEGAAPEIAYELLNTAATLLLPALCVHFFSQFPEPRASAGRRGAGVTTAYAVALLLCAGWALTSVLQLAGAARLEPVSSFLQIAAAVWFAAGLLVAVGLFLRSYLRAGTVDARRRLRVALIGTTLGLGPLAALTVWRNLAPGVSVPGERLAVVLTLLVPLSFTWATVIHRIFDFRVALRAAVAALLLSVTAGAVYVAGELATLLSPERTDYGGVSLALIGLAASLAGPARPLARALGRSLLPLREERPLSETLSVDALGRGATRGEVLTRAVAVLAEALKLDRCLGLDLAGGECREWSPNGDRALEPAERGEWLAAVRGQSVPLSLDELDLTAARRHALRADGVHWVLAVGADAPTALLLLGRRLAGPWLDRREVETLVRFARHVALALENVALRHTARSHGELDRELALAGEIQAHLLPRRAPIYPTLDCAAATLSSESVGGDYYDFVERSSRDLTLVVGDAAGKGVPAALRLAGVQARFRTEALRGQEPGPLLRALNLELSYHGHPENFVGLLCARIDVCAGRVHLANAGLEPPLLRRSGGEWEALDTGGLLLGVRPDAEYPDARVELGAGDLVLIYTDGLTEAQNGENLFGVPRVMDVVDRIAHRRASDIVQALIHEARQFADRRLDDLTVVALKQLADPPRAGRRTRSGSSPLEWRPIRLDETAEVVSPARAANPRAADPKG